MTGSLEDEIEPTKSLSPPRCHVVHGWLSIETYELLEAEAQRGRRHPDELVAQMLEAAIRLKVLPELLD